MQEGFRKVAQALDYMSGYDPKNYKKTDAEKEELNRARQREHEDMPQEKRLWKQKALKKKCKYKMTYLFTNNCSIFNDIVKKQRDDAR